MTPSLSLVFGDLVVHQGKASRSMIVMHLVRSADIHVISRTGKTSFDISIGITLGRSTLVNSGMPSLSLGAYSHRSPTVEIGLMVYCSGIASRRASSSSSSASTRRP